MRFPYYVLILRKRSWWGHSTALLSHNKSWRLRGAMECWTSILTLTFSRTLMARVVSSTRWQHFTSKEIPRYSFVFEYEWTPGLLNLDKKSRSLENFQGPYWESNPEPLFLWRSASTNCAPLAVGDVVLVIICAGVTTSWTSWRTMRGNFLYTSAELILQN
jgi:hypothetical protein